MTKVLLTIYAQVTILCGHVLIKITKFLIKLSAVKWTLEIKKNMYRKHIRYETNHKWFSASFYKRK